MKLGFDNEKYLTMQAEHIRQRRAQFGGKLYLEFGGKLFDDHHASRVLPGFQPDSKIRMLGTMKDEVEIVVAICAGDIEKSKMRGDLGISYDEDVLRLIDVFRSLGFYVGSVVITQYAGQPNAEAFIKRLESLGVKSYKHYPIAGYPSDVAHVVSDEGLGRNEYIETSRSVVVVTAPGPGSGKMATCLSQLYHEHRRGVAAGYAKFETFPIWNLPLQHPVNVAYESATADLKDVNMIDSFHLEAYGETAVNYNRDLEVFPVVRRIIEKITGEEAEYKSPTDMGVNRAGFGITDDEVCREAACQEIIRRYLIAECDYKKGKIGEDVLERTKLLMDDMGLCEDNRAVVKAAREYAKAKKAQNEKYKNTVAFALELEDGRFVTGRSSRRMVAAAAAMLNGVKLLCGIDDGINLISPEVLKSIQEMKTSILHAERTSLNLKEVLTALTISATTDPLAEEALEAISRLEGCRAHCTAILSDNDEKALKTMGIDATSDPEYATNNLYDN